MNQKRFYTKDGLKLIEEHNYPAEIRDYLLKEESIFAEEIARGDYQQVIEVGCMDGRFLLEATARTGRRYLGIDLIPELIELTKQRIRQLENEGANNKMTAIVGDVCNLPRIMDTQERRLVAFPFNSFGNLSTPKEALRAIEECNADVLIFAYTTNEEANATRKEYYENCKYAELEQKTTVHGSVLFSSKEGLASYAYSASELRSLLEEAGFKQSSRLFSKIGIMYKGTSQLKR